MTMIRYQSSSVSQRTSSNLISWKTFKAASSKFLSCFSKKSHNLNTVYHLLHGRAHNTKKWSNFCGKPCSWVRVFLRNQRSTLYHQTLVCWGLLFFSKFPPMCERRRFDPSSLSPQKTNKVFNGITKTDAKYHMEEYLGYGSYRFKNPDTIRSPTRKELQN